MEAQLMLTNPRVALRGHSRSPNMIPCVSYGLLSVCYGIVTFSLRDIRLLSKQ